MAALFFLTAMMAVAQLPDSGQKKITLADLKEENFHFEVVSIHRNRSADSPQVFHLTPEHFVLKNSSIKIIVMNAYEIFLEEELIHLPSWVRDESYDVTAKLDEPTLALYQRLSLDDQKKFSARIMKNLLRERFGLRTHTETHQLVAFDLILSKGGSKMKEASPQEKNQSRIYWGKIDAHALPFEILRMNLSSEIEGKVVDKTGLGDKKFTFTLTWTPEQRQTTENPGTSIYAALEEQLGLKLVATKAPVEVVVVDHIEKPSEN